VAKGGLGLSKERSKVANAEEQTATTIKGIGLE